MRADKVNIEANGEVVDDQRFGFECRLQIARTDPREYTKDLSPTTGIAALDSKVHVSPFAPHGSSKELLVTG